MMVLRRSLLIACFLYGLIGQTTFAMATPLPLKSTYSLQKHWDSLKWKRVQPKLGMSWSMQTWHLHNLKLSAPVEVHASLRTQRPLSSSEVQDFSQRGVSFLKLKGQVLSLGNFYPVTILQVSALPWLDQHPLVVQVDTRHNPFRPIPQPLEVTAKEAEATVLHQLAVNHKGLTGKGVVIGLIDSGVDVHHPALFRADGPWFAWIDANKDNMFTLGVDGVDWNKNGKLDADEVLRCHNARYYSAYYQPMDPDPQGACRIGQDWLYLDKNNNQKRDFGPSNGFKESDPTYGEPLFVVDDINRNGKLDLGEKVISLKTSKFKAVLYREKTYERGTNLIDLPVTPKMGGSGHGTLSASVMVGGQLGYQKHVGLAPGAELLVGVSRSVDSSGQATSVVDTAMTWLVRNKPQIILHEYSQWIDEFLDGSSNQEKAVSDAAKQGIVQITPVGNLGGQDKHAIVEVEANKSATVPIQVSWPSFYPPGYPPFQYVGLTLLWRGEPAPKLTFSLTMPDQTKVEVDANNLKGKVVATNTVMYSSLATSTNGTHKMHVAMLGFNHQTQFYTKLQQGEWQLTIKGDTSSKVKLHMFVTDDRSSWNQGVRFTVGVSDQSTGCWPSTADNAIGIGAYTGRPGEPYSYTPEKAGEIRAYSGAGPRIDGQPLLWLAAPDNPLAAVSPLSDYPELPIGYGQYLVYGGTSGASPHVAAAAALMIEMKPQWGHNEVKDALKIGSLADAQVGQTPNASWGYGKLRIYRTLFGKEPPSNTPPTLAYRGPTTFWLGKLPKELEVEASDNETQPEALRIWWDLHYNGAWEQQGSQSTLAFPFKEAGNHIIKIRVLDEQGASQDALLLIKVKACQEHSDCGDTFVCQDTVCRPAPGPEPGPERTSSEGQSSQPDGSTGEPPLSPNGPTDPMGCTCQSSPPPSLFLLWFLAIALGFRFRRAHRNAP